MVCIADLLEQRLCNVTIKPCEELEWGLPMVRKRHKRHKSRQLCNALFMLIFLVHRLIQNFAPTPQCWGSHINCCQKCILWITNILTQSCLCTCNLCLVFFKQVQVFHPLHPCNGGKGSSSGMRLAQRLEFHGIPRCRNSFCSALKRGNLFCHSVAETKGTLNS